MRANDGQWTSNHSIPAYAHQPHDPDTSGKCRFEDLRIGNCKTLMYRSIALQMPSTMLYLTGQIHVCLDEQSHLTTSPLDVRSIKWGKKEQPCLTADERCFGNEPTHLRDFPVQENHPPLGVLCSR